MNIYVARVPSDAEKVARVNALIDRWDGEIGALDDGQHRAAARAVEACLRELTAALAEYDPPHTPASDATRPPDAMETPSITYEQVWQAWNDTDQPWGGCSDREPVERVMALILATADGTRARVGTSEGRTEPQSDAGGMDNQGEELDRLRAGLAATKEALGHCIRSNADALGKVETLRKALTEQERDTEFQLQQRLAAEAKVERLENFLKTFRAALDGAE